ncbi:MAG TPA: glycosyltransferase family 39 protein [Granulicella sp.]
MRTTVVRPQDPELQAAVRLALLFAAIKLALHIAVNLYQAHLGWGYFRDEFYYIACGRHLAWGYVDHGPLVAVQARLSLALFGKSLAGIRMLSALAGAARVFLTGMLAWSLGGKRAAQALAMIGVIAAPIYLALDSFLSMNSAESLFWMLCLLALIRMLRGGDPRWWIVFGIAAGLGLLNKHSMTFFLLALLAALLLTPQRRLLASRWAALGVGLLLLIALPNLIWQVQNHWPTLGFLANGRATGKNLSLGPIAFLAAQIRGLGFLGLLVWVAGLIWLLRQSQWRWLGWMFLLFFAAMFALHAKDYYVAPVYPVLFAAGGIAWEHLTRRRNRAGTLPILEGCTIALSLFTLPLVLPVLPVEEWLRYTKATHLYSQMANQESMSSGVLPQFFADRFGWQEEVDAVTSIYQSLPEADKRIVGISCGNYGEAGALEFLGHNLPPVVSGHNNYWLWGPRGVSGEVMILVSSATPEELSKTYKSVQIAGRMENPYAMPFERHNIYLVRERRTPMDWTKRKLYN